MAQLYFRLGLHERTVRFEHFFRSYPDYGDHQAGYCVAAGLAPFVEWVTTTRATPVDVEALRGHRSRSGERLFGDDFCTWFASAGFDGLALERRARGAGRPPEHADHGRRGSARRGPAARDAAPQPAQLRDADRHQGGPGVEAAQGRPVLEFGMRRAAAAGADAASRAAIVGGAASTSNAAVGYELGVTPAGTHAHSMVQLFLALGEGEQAAFDAYADVYPDDTLLLVDTVDTLESGIPNAIATFERLRRAGHEPVGIRLDSGDLAYLAVQAARELDRAGFPDAVIVLSSQLDELTIWQIVSQISDEARRGGVRPRRRDRPAGVRGRLAPGDERRRSEPRRRVQARRRARRAGRGSRRSSARTPRRRCSTRAASGCGGSTTTGSGRHRRRALDGRRDRWRPAPTCISTTTPAPTCREPRRRALEPRRRAARPGARQGGLVYPGGAEGLDDLTAAAKRRADDVEALDPGVRRLVRPHTYHVSITDAVFDLKRRLLADLE